ncbi:MAG: hypothetical protein KME28_16540 [Pelatocladus maniniholoensis HA4357-MV3]|jgi:hypothetical protein|uniref:Uncharacterized protein n=1 Tax=Pelatocladus maniniholoensis HA4357-MV3 TaxID=1117104 RepID=A0A9E3H9I0_9NOST|nr:hypothetical protein [Pelatocladus maniniholoensis HA4357-MV3]BAZ70291.1 hypothetical protein NIES4106_50820 [Fischerella sp. NIES-4106]
MADLEKLVNELLHLADSLKLTIGNTDQIKNEIIRITNVQEQICNIREVIEEELGFEKIKNFAMKTLPFIGTVASIFIPGGFLVDAAITGSAGFIAEKFGNPETEITLNDLQEKIESWLEWCDILKEISEDILKKYQIINQIKLYSKFFSLPTQFQNIDDSLRINLAFGNSNILQQQKQKIINLQNQLLKIQQIINDIINYIENDDQDILRVVVGLSGFFGDSYFAIEWYDDEHGLIVSSDDKFKAVADVLAECKYFKEKTGTLIVQGNILRGQVEEAINSLQQKNQKVELSQSKTVTSLSNLEQKSKKQTKLGHLILLMTSSLAALIFVSLLVTEKLHQIQQIGFHLNQDGIYLTNLKSAEKLGMEAAVMVQNPPHPIEVWQQAKAKWQKALQLLETIPEGTSISVQAKKQLVKYRFNYDAINKRLMTEQKAMTNLQLSQKLAMEAAIIVQNPPHPPKVWQQAKAKWQQAIDLLEGIPDSVSISNQAKEKLYTYKTNYTAISTRLED